MKNRYPLTAVAIQVLLLGFGVDWYENKHIIIGITSILLSMVPAIIVFKNFNILKVMWIPLGLGVLTGIIWLMSPPIHYDLTNLLVIVLEIVSLISLGIITGGLGLYFAIKVAEGKVEDNGH